MKVLVVDEEMPFPPDTGKKLRTFNLLKRLQKQHQITYVCHTNGTSRRPDLPNLEFLTLRSRIIEQKGIPFYWALFKNLFSENPYIVDRHSSDTMRKAVAALIKSDSFALAHCEWTPYTENIRDLPGDLPVVLSAHNVEAQIWQRYCSTEPNLLKREYIRLQWKKVHEYEKNASMRYGEVITVSEPDKQLFETNYGCRNVTVVPNGVDELHFSPMPASIIPNSMVFTGSMDWRPNQDAIRYFIEEIFPLIRKELPSATLTVVGRRPPQWLVTLASKHTGITLTGSVPDVRPYIAQSALYVVPLRAGGGSRLKILEALSMEKAVLSTTLGAEGLTTKEGEHLLLRDTPHAFATTAVEVLTAPRRFEHLGKQGRALILASYTWDSIAQIMEHVWQRAARKN